VTGDGHAEGEFIATLAHELRTPLSTVLNGVHLMRLGSGNRGAVLDACALVERQARHMARIIDDVLDLCRSTRGQLSLHNEKLDLAQLVSRAVEIVNPLITARGHRLTISLPTEPATLVGDGCRLEQVLVNLLTNAAKYTEANGSIWLTADGAAGEVILRVRDTGIGIAPEMLPRIFDLFSRSERALCSAPDGLGIGLALVRKLVQAHGGCVTAASAGVGRGSEFVVHLPRRG